MSFQKLLFVTKFEALWFDALQSILDLKKAGLNHVVFLNVIEREKVSMRRGAGYQKKEEIKLREKANIRFIDWAENLFEQGMEAGVYIVVGDLVRQVVTATEKEGTDLIVLGRQKKKGAFDRLYSGSDITEIIRQSATPVLVYKYLSQDGQITERPFERPLLATNWSPACSNAVEYLKGLPGVVKEAHIIHVIPEKNLKGDSVMAVQKSRKESRQKLEDICDILETKGIRARPHVYVGNPFTEIERAARECRATMIVAGTAGKGGWKGKLAAGTSETLAEKSIFPTLLIPPDKHPQLN